jgi:hypothetical protein
LQGPPSQLAPPELPCDPDPDEADVAPAVDPEADEVPSDEPEPVPGVPCSEPPWEPQATPTAPDETKTRTQPRPRLVFTETLLRFGDTNQSTF